MSLDMAFDEIYPLISKVAIPFSGTLLQIFRDGVLLDSPGEDLDFAVKQEDMIELFDSLSGYNKSVLTCPETKEDTIKYRNEDVYGQFNEISFECMNTPINIYIPQKLGEYRVFVYWLPEKNGKRIHSIRLVSDRFFTNIAPVWFRDIKVNIPKDIEGCLETLYGDTWRIKNEDWDKSCVPCEWKRIEL